MPNLYDSMHWNVLTIYNDLHPRETMRGQGARCHHAKTWLNGSQGPGHSKFLKNLRGIQPPILGN
jgi:hypothetical protein